MKKIVIFALAAVAPILAAFAVWFLSLGYYMPAENWLKDVLTAKDMIAARTPSPRLLIVSGSNGLFGIDSHALTNKLGKPVINLATHAGLPLAFQVEMADRYTRPGDTVIMPLEYGYYAATEALTVWQTDNLNSWGADYVMESPLRMIEYFRSSSPSAAIKRLWEHKPAPSAGYKAVAAAVDRARPIQSFVGYTYRSLDNAGDIRIDKEPRFKGDWTYTEGIVSDYALHLLKDLRTKLEKRGAKLILVWPVSIQNPKFDLRTDHSQKLIARIEKKLGEEGLHVECNAAAFNYPRELFFDTVYHLNAKGTARRSLDLIKCLAGLPSIDAPLPQRE